ncbi:MAG: NAD(P)(+) transhydrogenase (Re/Si-specific) subunit beta [bacterium]|nr:NAD(P)(+) transhydrogenase (Re/Si-specific) subunit beta [bacterium]
MKRSLKRNSSKKKKKYHRHPGPSVPNQRNISSSYRFIRRYQEAYTFAHGTKTTGHIIMGIGIFLGIAIALILGSQLRQWHIIVGLGIGASVGLMISAIGVIIAAKGQTLLATLDTAVNTSPFLTDDERREVIG